MPIEIREMLIKAIIGSSGDEEEQAEKREADEEEGSSQEKRIVASCVEQVLEILKEREED